MFFILSLYVSSVICLILHLYTYKTAPRVNNAQFYGFQRTYLLVYLLAAGIFLISRQLELNSFLSCRLVARTSCNKYPKLYTVLSISLIECTTVF